MDFVQIGGGLVLCVGYLPQIRRIMATRSAHDLSLSMWLSVLAGLSLMEIYAAHLFLTTGTRAVLITNSLSLAFSICMVGLILTYGTHRTAIASWPRRPQPEASAPVATLTEVQQAA